MKVVRLTPQEVRLAAHAGVERRIKAIEIGRDERYADGHTTAWQGDIDGCIGELAVAKALGIYWTGQERINAPDCGRLEVRATRYRDGHLIVHDGDEGIFVLTVLKDDRVLIAGCIAAEKAREIGTRKTVRREGVWVHQSKLTPLKEAIDAS